MQYKFYIDGVEKTNIVELGASVKERFAEELDVGLMTLNFLEQSEPLQPLSRVKIEEYEGSSLNDILYFLIADDEVEPVTKGEPRLYRHTLELIELTHKLDYTIVNALTFTQPIVDLTSAPFVPHYRTKIGSFDSQGNGIGTASAFVEFTEPPKVYNKYIGSSIHVKQIQKANIYVADRAFPDDLRLFTDEHVLLTLFSVDETTGTETMVGSPHALSNSDFVVDGLNSGIYNVKIGIYGPITQSLLSYQEGSTFFGEIERWWTYQVRVSSFKQYTLYDVIKRIVDTYPIEKTSKHEDTRIFKISEELKARTENITAPQLYYNRLTMRESINNTLKYINAISRLVGGENEDKLLATFFNENRGRFLSDDTTWFSKSDSQSSLDYASVQRSFAQNVIASNNKQKESVIDLGDGVIRPLRSKDYQMLPENSILKIDHNIFRIINISALIRVRKPYVRISSLTGTVQQTEIVDELVDLTPYVVEENVFNIARAINDTFGNTGELDQFNTPFLRDRGIELATYRYGSDFIEFGGQVGSIYARTKLLNVIQRALAEKLQYEQGRIKNNFIFATNRVLFSQDISSANIFTKTDGGLDVAMTIANLEAQKDIVFRVSYIAQEDMVFDSHKADTTFINKQTENITQNNERVLNFERASISNYGIAQRLGVPTIGYGKISTSLNDETVGEVNEKRQVIVEREKVMYGDHRVLNYEASKDFNRLSKFVGVDRKYRPYEIPKTNEAINRDDVYGEFIEYSTSENLILPEANDTYMNNALLETVLNSVYGDNNRRKDNVKVALMRTDGFAKAYPDSLQGGITTRNSLLLPTITVGGKNTFLFKFGFKSNYSAGDMLFFNDNGINTIRDLWNSIIDLIPGVGSEQERPYGYWRRFVRYTDHDGLFEKLQFSLLTTFNPPSNYGDTPRYDFTSTLPVVSYSSSNSNNYFNDQNNNVLVGAGNPITFNNSLVINKDASEIYSFSYQVSLTPKTNQTVGDLIIGERFCSENLIVHKRDITPSYVYLYNDDTFYGTFDDGFVKNGWYSKLNFKSNSVIRYISGRPFGFEIQLDLTGVTSYAIGDDEGNLYIANNTNKRFINFEARNKRSTINYKW